MYLAAVCSPFASQLGRVVRLFQDLAKSGHRIELWGDSETEELAATFDLGFRHVPLSRNVKAAIQRNLDATQFYTEFAFPMTQQQIPRVIQYCRQSPPDLLYSNARVYTAAVAAQITGIPVVNHCFSRDAFGQSPGDLYGFCPCGTESMRKPGESGEVASVERGSPDMDYFLIYYSYVSNGGQSTRNFVHKSSKIWEHRPG